MGSRLAGGTTHLCAGVVILAEKVTWGRNDPRRGRGESSEDLWLGRQREVRHAVPHHQCSLMTVMLHCEVEGESRQHDTAISGPLLIVYHLLHCQSIDPPGELRIWRLQEPWWRHVLHCEGSHRDTAVPGQPRWGRGLRKGDVPANGGVLCLAARLTSTHAAGGMMCFDLLLTTLETTARKDWMSTGQPVNCCSAV